MDRSGSHESILAAFAAGEMDLQELAPILSALHPADAAELFGELGSPSCWRFFSLLDATQKAELISHLPHSEAAEAVVHLPSKEHAQILNALSDDDLVDILQEMDPAQRSRCLHLLPESKKIVAKSLLLYPEDSAGGRMTTALAAVQADMTIREAIEELRGREENTELLSRIFVVDENGKLVGRVRLRDLTFNRRSTHVADIMVTETISVPADADQEQAVLLMSKYGMLALPVVDRDFALIGVITYDDALEIHEEESTEDLERQSAISGTPSDEDYLDTSVLLHLRRRFGWVLVLAFLAITSGLVIFHYEEMLDRFFVLAIYMPMVVAAGGNTGGQAATMVIRAMSLGEFTPSSILKVAWKETRIGLLIGSLLGGCIALQITYFMPFETSLPENTTFFDIALTVGLALTVQITTSTLVGATLPIIAKTAKVDPAVVASPAITTIVDVSGLVIYFSLAKALLGI